MKSKSKQPNKILKIIALPYRALCKARDFYVNAMIDCANSNSIGLQRSSNLGGLPRSYSTASSRSEDKDDYRELIRAASARENIGLHHVDNYYIKNEMKKMMMMRGVKVNNNDDKNNNNLNKLRSSSLVMGRIDEDSPSLVLGEDDEDLKKKEDLKFPRSKSHAVARTSF